MRWDKGQVAGGLCYPAWPALHPLSAQRVCWTTAVEDTATHCDARAAGLQLWLGDVSGA